VPTTAKVCHQLLRNNGIYQVGETDELEQQLKDPHIDQNGDHDINSGRNGWQLLRTIRSSPPKECSKTVGDILVEKAHSIEKTMFMKNGAKAIIICPIARKRPRLMYIDRAIAKNRFARIKTVRKSRSVLRWSSGHRKRGLMQLVLCEH
jgi:hypothetical protein